MCLHAGMEPSYGDSYVCSGSASRVHRKCVYTRVRASVCEPAAGWHPEMCRNLSRARSLSAEPCYSCILYRQANVWSLHHTRMRACTCECTGRSTCAPASENCGADAAGRASASVVGIICDSVHLKMRLEKENKGERNCEEH